MQRHLFTILLILVILSGKVALAQPEMLKGTWITPEQDLIEILDTGRVSSNYLSNRSVKEDFFPLFIFGDTLSFQSIYTSSRTQFKIEYIDRYDLKIISNDDSTLVVKPISDLSKAYFQNRPFLKLKKKEYLVDTTIVFEKLVYHATPAWDGPTVDLQIDNNKNLYMNYRNNSGGFDKELASGNYSAVLDDDTYKELIRQLQTCNLRTLRFRDIKGADSPIKTFIVYFNGKRKYLKSMFPPRIAYDLLGFVITRLQRYPNLKLTDEKMELER